MCGTATCVDTGVHTGWRHLAVIATNDAPRKNTCVLDLTYGQSQRVEGFTVLVYLLTIFKNIWMIGLQVHD